MSDSKPVDALATLGTIIDETQKRDAIHLAVIPLRAGHRLFAGQDVGIGNDGRASAAAQTLLGIVDPFLKSPAQPDEWFWLVLYPRTITSLRHVWTHPAIPDEPERSHGATTSASERWLREYAEQTDVTYSRLMDGARAYVESRRRDGWGEYIIDGGRYEGVSVPDDFWTHYEAVTGEVVSEAHRGTFFSCSC